jgi:hypothetical protein
MDREDAVLKEVERSRLPMRPPCQRDRISFALARRLPAKIT